jgi:hypothetical protein
LTEETGRCKRQGAKDNLAAAHHCVSNKARPNKFVERQKKK